MSEMWRNVFRSRLLQGLLLTGVVEVGCAQSARYPLRLYALDERQLLAKASTVFVGETVGVEWQRTGRPINWVVQAGVRSARLVRVQLAVEQVVVGSVRNPVVTAYYWAPEVFTNGHSLHLPAQGERAVHYLVTEGDVLRYVADIGKSTTPIFSGYHGPSPTVGASAESKIAALLLTPGERMNVAEFIRNLSTAAGVSLQLVGFAGTRPLLKTLAEDGPWDVKWAACVQLYRSGFVGQDTCIDELAPEAVKQGLEDEVKRLRIQRAIAGREFRKAFLADPIRQAKEYACLPGDSGIADFLSIVSQHPDNLIAARAKETLSTCCLGDAPPE